MPAPRRLAPAMLALAALSILAVMPGPRAHAQTPEPVRPERAPAVTPAVIDARTLPPPAAQVQAAPHLHPEGEAALEHAKAEPAPFLTTPSVPSGPAPLTPSAGLGFDAIDNIESACGCSPPDGAIAVGPEHIVGAVNAAVEVWDKDGNTATGFPKSLASLFSGGGCYSTTISDPFAEYDRAADRYIVGSGTFDNAHNSIVCMAVSVTGDPAGSWAVYAFPAGGAHDVFDFPHAAIGSEALYVSGNLFHNASTYLGARIYAYPTADLYAGLPAAPVFVDVTTNAVDKSADTLTPVRNVTLPGIAYFISADNSSCPCSNVSLWRWVDPFDVSSSFTLQGGVTVTSYNQPPNARQPGFFAGRITTNDNGNLAGYWYDGTVYGAHSVSVNPGGGTVAGVQWYQLGDINATPTLLQEGIVAEKNTYRYFPNLSVDVQGNMTLAYAYSSSSDYAGIRYTGRLSSDPPGTVQPEAVLKDGEVTINGARYGDYAGAAVDLDGCTIWHLEEYAKSGAGWGTWAGSMKQPSCLAPSVGGIAELPDVRAPAAASNGGRWNQTAALISAAIGGALIGGLWYARRRRGAGRRQR